MKAVTKAYTFKLTCREDVPADKFHVGYGYKDESQIQIRLELPDDGVHHNVKEPQVYASVFPSAGAYNARSATVPLKLFVDQFYECLSHLNSVHHEEQQKQQKQEGGA
jgi:hypothetical protein